MSGEFSDADLAGADLAGLANKRATSQLSADSRLLLSDSLVVSEARAVARLVRLMAGRAYPDDPLAQAEWRQSLYERAQALHEHDGQGWGIAAVAKQAERTLADQAELDRARYAQVAKERAAREAAQEAAERAEKAAAQTEEAKWEATAARLGMDRWLLRGYGSTPELAELVVKRDRAYDKEQREENAAFEWHWSYRSVAVPVELGCGIALGTFALVVTSGKPGWARTLAGLLGLGVGWGAARGLRRVVASDRQLAARLGGAALSGLAPAPLRPAINVAAEAVGTASEKPALRIHRGGQAG